MSIRQGNNIIAGNPNLTTVVTTDSTQTITGAKTFTGTMNVPTSTDDVETSLEPVNVKYLYDNGYSEARTNNSSGEIGDIGFAPLGIDESLNLRRYLNGQVILQTLSPTFTSKLKSAIVLHPSLATTETNWQDEVLNSALGQCGKFVIDDTEGTIRLPRVVNAQGLIGLSNLGTIRNESLPNITGTWAGVYNSNGLSGAVSANYSSSAGSYPQSSTVDANAYGLYNIDASRSSSAYQNNAPVQQEAVQYPYYIQIATKVEETLPAIREYEINTPFTLGQSEYFETNPYNLSWLVSNGQSNSSDTYPDMWTQLHVELDTSINVGESVIVSGKTYIKRGLPVKYSTTAFDVFDWVVNESESTFRLPIFNGDEDLPSSNIVVNNPFSTTVVSGESFTAPCNGFLYVESGSGAGSRIIRNGTEQIFIGTASGTTAGNTLFLKKGDICIIYPWGGSGTATLSLSRFIQAVGKGILCYYVGDTIQGASLINSGAVLNALSNKIGYNELTTIHAIVETYRSGESWYRIYDDGWIEQGGLISYGNGTGFQSVYFLKPYSSVPNIQITIVGTTYNSAAALQHACNAQTRTTTYFTSYVDGNVPYKSWFACGQGA